MKFSHSTYHKFGWGTMFPDETFLVGVTKGKVKDMPKDFLDYDTRYEDEKGEGKNYPLNFDEGLLLFLYDPKWQRVFPTIRRWTPKKEEYYRSKLGQKLPMELVEDKK